MKARPILFSAPMIRALLEGRKTQTRRIVKSYWQAKDDDNWPLDCDENGRWYRERCPYGRPGDLLWVRETFAIENTCEYHGDHEIPGDGRPIKVFPDLDGDEYFLIPHYRATEPEPHIVPFDREDEFDDRTAWKPSIHMPRWASRITLVISSVRVERLQDISAEDADAEGIFTPEIGYANLGPRAPIIQYGKLWEEINGTGSWDANPWVWVIEFKVHQQNIDQFLKALAA